MKKSTIILLIVFLFLIVESLGNGSKGKHELTRLPGEKAYSSYSNSGSCVTTQSKRTAETTKKQSSAASSGSKKSGTTKRDSRDEFDADEYAHPDDFYYDHYNDFVDFEEAEDYWEDHN